MLTTLIKITAVAAVAALAIFEIAFFWIAIEALRAGPICATIGGGGC